MIKTTDVIINGNEYTITTFDAIKGNIILFKLIKYLRGGTSLFDSIKAALTGNDSVMDADLSELAIGSAIEKILSNIDPEEINDFFVMILRNTTHKNKVLDADFIGSHFAGNYFDMYKLLFEIIKSNYFKEGTKRFFDQARRIVSHSAGQKNKKATENTKDTSSN